ncbi:glycosyltransferase [Patescibacteria group bacterium]|nr:glycosyltransferase [Patescibacteria group bacterium]
MKIALAHDHLNQIGGAENVLAEFHRFYPEAPIFTLLHDQEAMANFTKDWDVRTSFIQDLPGGLRFFKWFLSLMPAAVEHFDLRDYDLVITSASALIKGVLVQPEAVNICYCHTPTRYLWSDTHSYTSDLPQPRIIKKVLPLVLSKLRQWDFVAAQRVDHYVANSNFVAARIAKYYRRQAKVIYPPVNTDLWGEPQEPEDFFLLVSRLRPYKKVDLAIKAFNKLGIPLKIIGSGEQTEELKALAGKNIEFLGQVTDQVKADYLARCRALIHPQEEDFGLTVIEAMAAGRPVIAYAAGGALETINPGQNGVFFKEQSWEALADAVIRFRYQDFDQLAIQQTATRFSRQQFAQNWQAYVDGLKIKNNL